MPASGRGANLVPKTPLKNPLPPNPKIASAKPPAPKGEAHAPMANLPAYKAPGKPSLPRGPFSPKLEATFGALGKQGVGAPSKLAKDQRGAQTAHSPFSLHALESIGQAIGGATEHALHATYGQPAPKGVKGTPVAEAGRIGAPGAAIANTIPSVKLTEGLGTALKNVPKSTADTIVGTVPALYGTAKAGVEAAKGNPKELEAIGKGIGQVIAHPWSSFQQNPVGTALMFAAPESAVGRGAGAVMRSGALGEKAAQVASMDRAPLYVYGKSTGASTDQIAAGLHDVALPRSYSPNVIRKGGQVAADTFKQNVLKHAPNVATHEQANRLLYGGGLLGQYALRGRLQGAFKPGLVDLQSGTGEMLRRLYSNSASHLMDSIKPKHGAEAVPLAVEGVVRRPDTLVGDLHKERARLIAASDGLTGREAKLNRVNQLQVEKLLADKKFLANPQPAFDAATHYAATMRPVEERLVHLGHLEPDQLHARNMSYAMAHMGDQHPVYNEKPGSHPLVAQVASAKRAIGSAEKAVQRAMGRREGRLLPSTVKPVSGWHRAVEDARTRLMDARGAHHQLSEELHHLKLAGAVKGNGELWPRLEQNGHPLPAHEIEAHMAGKQGLGDRNVAFLTHKSEQSYGKALQSYAGKRPGTEVRRRTGVAFQNGTYDRSFNALKLQAYKNVNAVAGHENFDQMLRRFGIGRFRSEDDAKRALDNFVHGPEGRELETRLGKMTVQRIGPDRVVGRDNVQTRLLGPAARDYGISLHKGVDETFDTPKFTLLPETVARRIREHDKLNNPGGLKRSLQWYTGKFRSAKLFTSPRWMLGNPQEHAIRLAAASINPFGTVGLGSSVKLGKDLIGRFQAMAADHSLTEAQRYVARAQVGSYAAGTHYGSLVVNDVHRELKDPNSASLGRELGTAFDERTPVSQMIAGWNKYKGVIGKGMGKIEQNTQAALLGHAALNEYKKFGSDWRQLITRQDQAVQKYAMGKLSPNESAKLGSDILEMSGNWTKLTPKVREAVQTITPFGLWWLNSMKFVFRTMPRDHPFKTAALAAMEAGVGTEAELEKAPGYLHGGIHLKLPVVGSITATPGYYTPWGIGMEPTKTAGEQVIPQLEGPLATLGGINKFKAEKLVDSHRKPLDPFHLLTLALRETAEGPTPFASQAVQLGQQGGTPDPGSLNPFAIKPGTKKGIEKTLLKTVSPLRFTYDKQTKKGEGRERTERERPERKTRERPERGRR